MRLLTPRRALISLALALTLTLVSAAGAGAVRQPDATPGLNSGFQHGTVVVDGGKLHYVKGGSGPVLVLLHGWPATWWSWHDVMPALAQNFTVLAFDLPGLGDSSHAATGYDKATTAMRIRQGVRNLGYQQVGVVGHDVGAMVAFNYARDFPGEVTRLIVMEAPLPGFGLEDVYGLSWHFLFNSSPAPIPETIMDNNDVPTYLNMMYDFAVHPEGIDRAVYIHAYSDPADRTSGYNYYRAYPTDAADYQAKASTNRPGMPLVAMGAEMVFGPGVAASFSAVADDVRTAVAPGSGHYIPEEVPQYVIDCVKLFFGPAGGVPSTPELAGCAP